MTDLSRDVDITGAFIPDLENATSELLALITGNLKLSAETRLYAATKISLIIEKIKGEIYNGRIPN